MSLQWTLVSVFLWAEVGTILLFLLTLSRGTFWKSFFDLRVVRFLAAQSTLVVYATVAVLILFFGESIREFQKYSAALHSPAHLGSVAYYEDQMRLFRAQRNFYISGFSLFCLFIIKRLASLFSTIQPHLLAQQQQQQQSHQHSE